MTAKEARELADKVSNEKTIELGVRQYNNIKTQIEKTVAAALYSYTIEEHACNTHCTRLLKLEGYDVISSRQPYEENYTIISW